METKNDYEVMKKNILTGEDALKGINIYCSFLQVDCVGPYGLGNCLVVYKSWLKVYDRRQSGEKVKVFCSDEIDKAVMLEIKKDKQKYCSEI